MSASEKLLQGTLSHTVQQIIVRLRACQGLVLVFP